MASANEDDFNDNQDGQDAGPSTTNLTDAEVVSKRTLQNRKSQREFRQRRAAHLKDLEARVRMYESGQSETVVELQRVVMHLQSENEQLRSIVAQYAPQALPGYAPIGLPSGSRYPPGPASAPAGPAPPPSFPQQMPSVFPAAQQYAQPSASTPAWMPPPLPPHLAQAAYGHAQPISYEQQQLSIPRGAASATPNYARAGVDSARTSVSSHSSMDQMAAAEEARRRSLGTPSNAAPAGNSNWPYPTQAAPRIAQPQYASYGQLVNPAWPGSAPNPSEAPDQRFAYSRDRVPSHSLPADEDGEGEAADGGPPAEQI